MNSEHQMQYPLSFIDAVNKKQLDLESGYFKEPNKYAYTLNLSEAIKQNLLNPATAYVTDSNLNRATDLKESLRLGLITSLNRIVTPTHKLSLADALKTGHLKIGEQVAKLNDSLNSSMDSPATNSSCSISSETQSMSVKSIKDPSTGEFLPPTEAIKRKLLDPYKGLFIHPVTGEHMPISEAIQKAYVLVEMIPQSLTALTTQTSGSDRHESNVISTSLIRETKSYHLLGVYDPLKNDEVSIKEAIARGSSNTYLYYIKDGNKSWVLLETPIITFVCYF